ncbi:Uncharacterised protein [Aerococcus viridans]|nr:Uncharacterised protein [Aerococcus viridans]
MEYKKVELSEEEAKIVIEEWLIFAFCEGGNTGDDFEKWFPIIKKIAPVSSYQYIAEAIDINHPLEITLKFRQYVGLT